MTRYDIAIIGSGIAGASLASEVAPHARVLLLEAEAQPGYHSTGRSAAFWSETYGGPDIQPLTTASGPALKQGGFLQQLGSLHIGREDDAILIDGLLNDFAGSSVELTRVNPRDYLPDIAPAWVHGILEPSCAYIDVAALHADCLSRARRAGAELKTSAALTAATRGEGGWNLETTDGAHKASVLVNAAGAWADDVAARAGVKPLGIQPYRRTMLQIRTNPQPSPVMPLVADIAGNFYFKPESGRLWLSPHDETPVHAHDVAPEEIDVAIAIDRFAHVVDWRVEAVERKWAGLRSFAHDRLPIYGFDPKMSGFFWCAGQGGFGIQTAPAAASLAAALLLSATPHADVAAIDPARYAPGRFA